MSFGINSGIFHLHFNHFSCKSLCVTNSQSIVNLNKKHIVLNTTWCYLVCLWGEKGWSCSKTLLLTLRDTATHQAALLKLSSSKSVLRSKGNLASGHSVSHSDVQKMWWYLENKQPECTHYGMWNSITVPRTFILSCCFFKGFKGSYTRCFTRSFVPSTDIWLPTQILFLSASNWIYIVDMTSVYIKLCTVMRCIL